MKHQRNVEGLRRNAQRKRQEALERTEQALRQLIKDGKPVNFTTVSQAAQVSTAFLYKESDFKARIEHLRSQSLQKKPIVRNASSASQEARIRTLNDRIRQLEKRIRELSQQNEVFGGQVLRVHDLEQHVQRLQVENERLRCQLDGAQNIRSIASTETDVEAELSRLGVQLNSTLRRAMRDVPRGILETAIASLEQAIVQKRVENPSGFFYRAVTDAWKPNSDSAPQSELDEFNEWWKLAHAAGLVIAATRENGIHYVIRPDQQYVPFCEMLAQHPLGVLKGDRQGNKR